MPTANKQRTRRSLLPARASRKWLHSASPSLLYGVRPTDLLTFVRVAILLAAVATFASYLSARGAVRADPLTAIRYE